MKNHSPIYKTFDIVLAPYPFFDKLGGKIRPCLVLSSHDSFNKLIDQCIVAMITTAKNSTWPYDTKISNPLLCGLIKPCLVRLKLLTIPNNLLLKKLGRLPLSDRFHIQKNLQLVFHAISLFDVTNQPPTHELLL